MMQSPQVDDHDLVQALVHEFYSGLFRFALYQSGDRALANQIAQNAIWTAVHDRHRYWGDPPIKIWIYSLAQKSTKGRDRDDRPGGLSSVLQQTQKPLDPSSQNGVEESSFGAALSRLPNKQRLILLLRYADGFSVAEISHILGMSQNSTQHQIQYLRETLMDDLFPDEKRLQNHKLFTRQIQAAVDGSLIEDGREELKQHLWECKDCQAYAARLDQLEKKLGRQVNQIWPPIAPVEGEAQVVSAIEAYVQEKTRSRLLSASIKETVFVGLIVVVVLVIGVIAKVTAPANPSQSLQNLSDESATQPAITNPAEPPQASAPKAGTIPLPSTGDGNPWHQNSYRHVPGQYDLLKFDSLLRSPASHLTLSGINQSGSASLTMDLRFWGWTGNAISDLQPNSSDPTVLPNEILDYVQSKTGLKAIQRFAGDLTTLKRLIYSGIPVIVETGIGDTPYQPWSSQYQLITGYSDDWNSVKVLASYDIPGVYADIDYDDFSRDWQAFNYLYIAIYPSNMEGQVNRILGANADAKQNSQFATQLATNQTGSTDLLEQFFAWYNWGTSLMQLNNHELASKLYDKAFAVMDQIPEDQRPWRILWYDPSPYQAYFDSGRYQDVVRLTTESLMSNNNLQESYYWRALAEEALGQNNSAIIDMSKAVRLNPNFSLGVAWLARFRDGG